MLDNGNEALGSADLTSAHASNPDHGAGDERPAQRVRAADVIVGATALDHGHEAVDDAEVERAIAAVAVRPDGARDAVEDGLAVAGELGFDAPIDTGETAEWIGSGERHVLIDGPRHSAIPDGADITPTVEV